MPSPPPEHCTRPPSRPDLHLYPLPFPPTPASALPHPLASPIPCPPPTSALPHPPPLPTSSMTLIIPICLECLQTPPPPRHLARSQGSRSTGSQGSGMGRMRMRPLRVLLALAALQLLLGPAEAWGAEAWGTGAWGTGLWGTGLGGRRSLRVFRRVIRRHKPPSPPRSPPSPPQPPSPPPPPELIPLDRWAANLSGIGTGSKQAATPLMGWNTYNQFPMGVNDTLVREMAQAMVRLGLAKLGYTLMSLDDDWAAPRRDANKNLQGHPQRYPYGMANLTSYIHSLGLKMGIYSDAGTFTCHKSQPGSLGFEQKDATQFASWGIDYLKYDNCNNENVPAETRYRRMAVALRNTGRDIHYNLCTGGAYDPARWARTIADSWRTAFDQRDNWATMYKYASQNNKWAPYAGPGGFNDLDALEVGNGGMTTSEYRIKFSLWSLMKSPLMLGCDLRIATPTRLSIIGNAEVIAINQDPLGVQGRRVFINKYVEVWAGPLSRGRMVVGLVNRVQTSTRSISVDWNMLRLNRPATFNIRSIWEDVTLNNVSIGQWTYPVGPRDIALLVLTPMQ